MNTKLLKKFLDPARRYPSKIIIWISLLIITVVNISYENWNHEYKIIAWDVNSYYAYLPVVFIYQDLDMDFMRGGDNKFSKHYWPVQTETGKKAIITSMGLAYLYSPFFLAGHGIANLTIYAGDEFSAPYKISLIVSCLFYLAIGLIFLRKVLRMYYSELISSITLVLILFATNLLHYVTEEPTMPHAYNFSLISIFLFLLSRWFSHPGIKYAILTGALAGLITLIRPSNIIVILLLVFWGITSFHDLGSRIKFYFRNFHLVILMIIAFILVWVPQFLYWDYTSGSIFFNTYGSVGGKFFFNNPQIYHTLLSYRKGWFVYTPLMFLALFGFYFLYKNKRGLFWPIIIYLFFNVYILSSWWTWWMGGSFGLRSFVDSYGLMAFPLAALLTWALKQKRLIKYTILLMIAATMYLNIFQVIQYKKGFLHNKSMTKTSYWASFLDMTPGNDYWDNLVRPDYQGAKVGRYYTEKETTELEKREAAAQMELEIQKYEEQIRSNPAYMEYIKEKADKWGTTTDSLVRIDAGWLYRKSINEANED